VTTHGWCRPDIVSIVTALLAQLPALVGVVVGTLGTLLVTGVADHARWRRDQSVRWDQRRLEAYVEYARALKEIHLLTFRLSASRRPRAKTPPIDHEAGLELLAQAEAHRTKMWETVLLMGDPVTVTAARQWRDAIWQLELLASDQAGDGAGWMPAVRAADQARDEFYAAARASLGVAGTVAQAPWLVWRQENE
jgi:hypothetical protein